MGMGMRDARNGCKRVKLIRKTFPAGPRGQTRFCNVFHRETSKVRIYLQKAKPEERNVSQAGTCHIHKRALASIREISMKMRPVTYKAYSS